MREPIVAHAAHAPQLTTTVEPLLSGSRLTGCSLYPAKHLGGNAHMHTRTILHCTCILINAQCLRWLLQRKGVVPSIESKIAAAKLI